MRTVDLETWLDADMALMYLGDGLNVPVQGDSWFPLTSESLADENSGTA
jgi:hypothetical protein